MLLRNQNKASQVEAALTAKGLPTPRDMQDLVPEKSDKSLGMLLVVSASSGNCHCLKISAQGRHALVYDAQSRFFKSYAKWTWAF